MPCLHDFERWPLHEASGTGGGMAPPEKPAGDESQCPKAGEAAIADNAYHYGFDEQQFAATRQKVAISTGLDADCTHSHEVCVSTSSTHARACHCCQYRSGQQPQRHRVLREAVSGRPRGHGRLQSDLAGRQSDFMPARHGRQSILNHPGSHPKTKQTSDKPECTPKQWN